MSNGPNILLKYFVIHGNTLQTAAVLRNFFQDFSTILAMYGTAESRIFLRTPAGHTAERKTKRKRNRGC